MVIITVTMANVKRTIRSGGAFVKKKQDLSEAARRAKNAYAREWREKNPERVKAIQRRYWERKAKLLEEQAGEARDNDDGI